MGAFATVGIQDMEKGSVTAVGRDGALLAAPGLSAAGNQVRTVTTTWDELLPKNEDRRQVQIQNQDAANAVLIRLDDGAGTGAPYRIDPGVTYSFPPGVTYRGAVQAATAADTAIVAVIEFNEPSEDE